LLRKEGCGCKIRTTEYGKRARLLSGGGNGWVNRGDGLHWLNVQEVHHVPSAA
jgi:hypothetical protein